MFKDESSLASKLLFYVPFCLWVAASILIRRSAFGDYITEFVAYSTIRHLCLGCLAVREVLFGKRDMASLAGLAVLGSMAYMSYLAKYPALFDTIWFAFCGRNLPFRDTAKVSLALTAGLLLFVVTSSLIGVVPDSVIIRGESVQRHHLGFVHPNVGPGMLFFAICAWGYLRGRRYNAIDCLALLCIVLAAFILTNSRIACSMAALASLMFFVVNAVPRSVSRKCKPLVLCGVASVAACCVVSVTLTACYNPEIEWMNALNTVASGRLVLGHNALMQHGLDFFGRKMDLYTLASKYDKTLGIWVSTGQPPTIVDCSYMRILINCGVYFLVMGIGLCTAAAANAHLAKEWRLVMIIAMIAVFEMFEIYAPFAYNDAFILLIGCCFSQSQPLARRITKLFKGRALGES